MSSYVMEKQIAELAMKNRLPLMGEGSDFAEAGVLAVAFDR